MQRFFTKVSVQSFLKAKTTLCLRMIQIGETKLEAGIKGVLSALNRRLEQSQSTIKAPKVDWNPYPTDQFEVKNELTQDYLWDVRREE